MSFFTNLRHQDGSINWNTVYSAVIRSQPRLPKLTGFTVYQVRAGNDVTPKFSVNCRLGSWKLRLPSTTGMHRCERSSTFCSIVLCPQIHSVSARRGLQLWRQAEGHPHGGDAERPDGASQIQVWTPLLRYTQKRHNLMHPYHPKLHQSTHKAAPLVCM